MGFVGSDINCSDKSDSVSDPVFVNARSPALSRETLTDPRSRDHVRCDPIRGRLYAGYGRSRTERSPSYPTLQPMLG